jgi:hypothetical protein
LRSATERPDLATHPPRVALAAFIGSSMGRYDHLLLAVLAYEAGGSNDRAAQILGVSVSTLRRYRREYRARLRQIVAPYEEFFGEFGHPWGVHSPPAPLDKTPPHAVK